MSNEYINNLLIKTNDITILPKIKELDLFSEFNCKLTNNNSYEVIKDFNIKTFKIEYNITKKYIENININLKYLNEIKQKYSKIIESLQLSFNYIMISKNENTNIKDYILNIFNNIESNNINFYMFEFLKTNITNDILNITDNSIISTLNHFKLLYAKLEEQILKGKSFIKEYKKKQYKIINTIKFYNKIHKNNDKTIKEDNNDNDNDNDKLKEDITEVSREKKTKLNSNSKRKKESQISLNLKKKKV